MVEPLTLAAVGAVALTEGIKFLYGQAGEALKRWRERKAAKAAEPAVAQPIEVQLPASAFVGQLHRPKLDLAAVERLEEDLKELRSAVADYAQEIDDVNPKDKQLLQIVDGLRRAMEAVYGQRLTFKGEPGLPSGAEVTGEAKVDEVLGYVAGLRAKRIISGSATGRIDIKKVGPEGEAVGLEVDTIG